MFGCLIFRCWWGRKTQASIIVLTLHSTGIHLPASRGTTPPGRAARPSVPEVREGARLSVCGRKKHNTARNYPKSCLRFKMWWCSHKHVSELVEGSHSVSHFHWSTNMVMFLWKFSVLRVVLVQQGLVEATQLTLAKPVRLPELNLECTSRSAVLHSHIKMKTITFLLSISQTFAYL